MAYMNGTRREGDCGQGPVPFITKQEEGDVVSCSRLKVMGE